MKEKREQKCILNVRYNCKNAKDSAMYFALAVFFTGDILAFVFEDRSPLLFMSSMLNL